jgi:hypothetical protein
LDEVMRGIGLGSPLIVVAGPAGSGKTLLLNLVERDLREGGQAVQRLEPGDPDDMLGQTGGVLLVDNVESADQARLQSLFSAGADKPPAVVVACQPSFATRFGAVAGAMFVKLTSHSQGDAKSTAAVCGSDAGALAALAPEAVEASVDSMGSPPPALPARHRLGVIVAASDRIAQVGFQHVTDAIATHGAAETPNDRRDEPQSSDGNNVVADDIPLASAPKWQIEYLKTGVVRPPREPLWAALIIAAVILPLLLFGKAGDNAVEARAAGESPAPIAARSNSNPLAAMGKVAAAELPRPVLLAVITPSPLQALRIGVKNERVAGKALPSPKEEKIAGRSAIVSGPGAQSPKTANSPAQSASLARSQSKAVKTPAQNSRTADNSRLANAARDKAPGQAPARAQPPSKTSDTSIATRPPSVRVAEAGIEGASTLLSRDQVARLLRDLSGRAGFAPKEYSALQACVYGKMGAGPVEADVFRSLVRRCVL